MTRRVTIFRAVAILLALVASLRAQPVNPNIHINNLTGVNGQASGAPSNLAAVYLPLGCSTTGSSTTINAPTHGMGAYPTDGSSALWVNAASGRRWSKITGFPDGDHITVEDAFNLGAAVDCAVGGKIAGTLRNVTRLCEDPKAGWTITLEHTGTDYTDSGASCNLAVTGSTATQGRPVVRGDDPDNPTRILWGSNNQYLQQAGSSSWKFENLDLVKNAAGTTGAPIILPNLGGVLKNIRVSNQTGQWNSAYIDGGSPGVVLLSLFSGAFAVNCRTLDDDDLVIGNFFDLCSGSGAAITLSGAGVFLFNLLDNGGANVDGIDADRVVLFNTLLNIGRSAVSVNTASTSVFSGNLIGEGSTLGGNCFDTATSGSSELGGDGEPHVFWQGNNAHTCPTSRYNADLTSSPQGKALDIDAGSGADPSFTDSGASNFFPLNAAMKSDTVFPGLAFPFQTTAAPVSVPTAGAAQRLPAGASAYAF